MKYFFTCVKSIEQEIVDIRERNVRVEMEKAWERSFFRKGVIAVLTYAVVVLFFFVAQLPHPLINALVPTFGFLLSTLSLPFFQKIWFRYFHQ